MEPLLSQDRREMLYIGIANTVLAMDAATGEEVWRAVLQKNALLTSVALVGSRLLAASNGELYCLNTSDGSIIWHNKLKKLGLGLIIIAGEGSGQTAALYQSGVASSSGDAAF